MKNSIFKQIIWPVLSLTIICIVVSLALGATNMVTSAKIQANLDAVNNAGRQEVLPDADKFTVVELTQELSDLGVTEAAVADNGGMVINVQTKGYGGELPIMVGFDAGGAITRIKILDNSETPGVGKREEEESFYGQFSGLQGDISGVNTLAGATVSSTSVKTSVQNAIAAQKLIGEGA